MANIGDIEPIQLIIGFAMLIRKEVWKTIGGLDPIYGFGNCEDSDYCLRTMRIKYCPMLCGDIFIDHIGSASFNKAEFDYVHLIINNQIYSHFKHFERKQALSIIQDSLNSVDKNESISMCKCQKCTRTLSNSL